MAPHRSAAAPFSVGAILLVLSPQWWGWYVRLLDPRYWSFRAWIIAAAILVEIVVVIRFWAKHTIRLAGEEAAPVAEAAKRWIARSILLVAVLCIVESMMPWSDLPWYSRRMVWYWTTRLWVKFAPMAFFAATLLLMLWIRSRLRRRARMMAGSNTFEPTAEIIR